MRCACIDIGSNTTRLLVAEQDPAGTGLRELASERVFTAIGAAVRADGSLPAELIAQVAVVVVGQVAAARRHGAARVRAVATAAIRRAPNRDALAAALAAHGLELEVLSGEQEARLAYLGAVGSLRTSPPGPVAVVDVGGGSTEVVVGWAGAEPGWWESLPVGSSSLTGRYVCHDPPSSTCLEALYEAARDAFAAVNPPPAELVLAVGGSATSLVLPAVGRGTGGAAMLDDRSLRGVLDALTTQSVAATAALLGLHPERARVLPAGIILLARASLAFARPLQIVRGGLREGVVREMLVG